MQWTGFGLPFINPIRLVGYQNNYEKYQKAVCVNTDGPTRYPWVSRGCTMSFPGSGPPLNCMLTAGFVTVLIWHLFIERVTWHYRFRRWLYIYPWSPCSANLQGITYSLPNALIDNYVLAGNPKTECVSLFLSMYLSHEIILMRQLLMCFWIN